MQRHIRLPWHFTGAAETSGQMISKDFVVSCLSTLDAVASLRGCSALVNTPPLHPPLVSFVPSSRKGTSTPSGVLETIGTALLQHHRQPECPETFTLSQLVKELSQPVSVGQLGRSMALFSPLLIRMDAVLQATLLEWGWRRELAAGATSEWEEQLLEAPMALQPWARDTAFLETILKAVKAVKAQESPPGASSVLAHCVPPYYVPVRLLAVELQKQGDWSRFTGLCRAWLTSRDEAATRDTWGVQFAGSESPLIRRCTGSPSFNSFLGRAVDAVSTGMPKSNPCVTLNELSIPLVHMVHCFVAWLVPTFLVRSTEISDLHYAETLLQFCGDAQSTIAEDVRGWRRLLDSQPDLKAEFQRRFPVKAALFAHPTSHAALQFGYGPDPVLCDGAPSVEQLFPVNAAAAEPEVWIRLHPLFQHVSSGRANGGFTSSSVTPPPPPFEVVSPRSVEEDPAEAFLREMDAVGVDKVGAVVAPHGGAKECGKVPIRGPDDDAEEAYLALLGASPLKIIQNQEPVSKTAESGNTTTVFQMPSRRSLKSSGRVSRGDPDNVSVPLPTVVGE